VTDEIGTEIPRLPLGSPSVLGESTPKNCSARPLEFRLDLTPRVTVRAALTDQFLEAPKPASRAAAEAVEEPAVEVHAEGRPGVPVEHAAHKAGAPPAEQAKIQVPRENRS
jgi:hypothetical protein